MTVRRIMLLAAVFVVACITLAGIQVRGIDGLVFPPQNVGSLRRQTAQNGAFSVDHVPLALVQIHFRQMRLHLNS